MRTSRTGNFNRKGRVSGFTLLELMVVLLIVGFFAAFFSIRVENVLSGGDLRLASRMIVGEIAKLRGRAAYSHKLQVLTFNIDENSYLKAPETEEARTGLFQDRARGRLKAGTRLPDGVNLEDVVILSKGKFQEGEVGLTFYENGCVDGALIHLRNNRQEAYTLEVTPLTGRVIIYDRYMDRKTTA